MQILSVSVVSDVRRECLGERTGGLVMNDGPCDAIDSTTSTAVSDSGSPVKAEPAAALCPYCGSITPAGARCSHCRGLLDPLSRQATTNTMGPWFIRDDAQPFRPGCSYHTLVGLIQRGKVTRTTIIRGPSTRQFWMFAGKVPGVAHLLGVCHSCQEESHADDFACNNCGAVFTAEEDRQRLGLGPVMEVPGQALPEVKAAPRERTTTIVRGSHPPQSPASIKAIMDDPSPWRTPSQTSSGMMVGGVVLALAALAAAGFAVKTWVDTNRPEQRNLGTPSIDGGVPPAAPVVVHELPSPPPQASPEVSPKVADPSPPQDIGQPRPPVTLGPGPTEPTPVLWTNSWRTARGLP